MPLRREAAKEHPCRSAISIKLLCNLIEITLRHRCSPVNLYLFLGAPLGGHDCKNNVSITLIAFLSCTACNFLHDVKQKLLKS